METNHAIACRHPLFGLKTPLQHWFMAGLGTSVVPGLFQSEWRRLVAFALDSPNWNQDSERLHLRDDRWKVLMGLDSSLLWISEHRSVLAGIKDLFEKWAKTHLKDYDLIIAFCRFLENPAAADLVCPGITWLSGIDLRLRSGSVGRHVSEALASMLAVVWSTSPGAIRADAEAFNDYKSLLRQLCEFQNPTALELSDRLSR